MCPDLAGRSRSGSGDLFELSDRLNKTDPVLFSPLLAATHRYTCKRIVGANESLIFSTFLTFLFSFLLSVFCIFLS